MDGGVATCEALYEAVIFLRYFNGLPDTRRRDKVVYPLDEVLLLCLLAVLAGRLATVAVAAFHRAYKWQA